MIEVADATKADVGVTLGTAEVDVVLDTIGVIEEIPKDDNVLDTFGVIGEMLELTV